MADKKPIGHSVKGSNGRDVHTVGPLVARRARFAGRAWRPGVRYRNTCIPKKLGDELP